MRWTWACLCSTNLLTFTSGTWFGRVYGCVVMVPSLYFLAKAED